MILSPNRLHFGGSCAGPVGRPLGAFMPEIGSNVIGDRAGSILPFSPCGRRWREAPDEGFYQPPLSLRQTPPPSAMLRVAPTLSHKGRGEGEAALIPPGS